MMIITKRYMNSKDAPPASGRWQFSWTSKAVQRKASGRLKHARVDARIIRCFNKRTVDLSKIQEGYIKLVGSLLCNLPLIVNCSYTRFGRFSSAYLNRSALELLAEGCIRCQLILLTT